MNSPSGSGPLLPPVVKRRRLYRLLGRVAAPGIVAVSAQAAQGKTTLVADYLGSANARCCWMTLAPDDADPVHFGRHLARACQPFSRSADFSADAKPGLSTAEIIANLFDRLPPDLNLVFDDWHRLGPPALVSRRIKAILAARPAQGHIYFLGRENLPIELQRNRMRRQALVLSDSDLAFTEEEIDVFFKTINAVALDAECRQAVLRLTAGWAGALVILAEKIKRHSGREAKGLSGTVLAEFLQTEAAEFFQEEVYGQQPKPLQTFLARCALLDHVPADLMRNVLDKPQADHMISEVLRQHLFVESTTNPPGQWKIQINPLFRLFLRTRALRLLSADEIHRFFIQAARYYQSKDELEKTAACYVQAGNVDAATRTITTLGIKKMINGRFDEIARLTGLLPPAAIAADPWLNLLQATVFRIRGGRRTIRELRSAHQAFVKARHIRGQMFALAYLIETGVFIDHAIEELQTWITAGQRLLRETSHLPYFNYAKALLWQQIGLGILLQHGGDLRRGLSACDNAVVLGKRIGSHPLMGNTLIIAAHAHVQAGEFNQAQNCLKAARAFDADGRFPEYAALRFLTEFYLALMGAQITAAAQLLEKMNAAIDDLGLISLYPAYLEASGVLQIQGKQYTALEKTCRHLHDAATLFNNPIHRATGFWLAGIGGYHQERYHQAEAALRQAMSISGLPSTHSARNRSVMGFIALNTGQLAEAGVYFGQALRVFVEKGLTWQACEAHLGMALLQNASRNTTAAEESLEIAFQPPVLRRYELFPIISPTDLARACVLSIQLNVAAAAGRARYLLSHWLNDVELEKMACPETSEPLGPPTDFLETRRAIYRARIPVLAIQTLGGLQIRHNGKTPLLARSWQGSRPALLLKAILVHGGRHIPKDILIEAVWPDRPPAHSLQNFKVTLHRLRKLLEPDLDPSRGSAYIHLKDNLVSLDKHLCHVDTDMLHLLFKRIRRADQGIDAHELLAMRREAEALYRGDFLPEEPYLTWAEIKRTNLRQEFILFMFRLGRRFQDLQAFGAARGCYRRIIQIDPGHEKAHRRLMELLDGAGRSQEALKVFHRLEAFLQAEIGAAPDEATTRLFQTLRDRLR